MIAAVEERWGEVLFTGILAVDVRFGEWRSGEP